MRRGRVPGRKARRVETGRKILETELAIVQEGLKQRKFKPGETLAQELLAIQRAIMQGGTGVKKRVAVMLRKPLIGLYLVPKDRLREVGRFIIEKIEAEGRFPVAREYTERFPKLKGKTRLF